MKPEYYRIIGWACVLIPVVIALHWCTNERGLAAWFLAASEKLFETELVQLTWLLTFAILCFPGYIAKRYMDERAWNLHIASMPPPDKHASARRSKYIEVNEPLKPLPSVDFAKARESGKDFIATCTACGHFFPVVAGTKDVKCPTCGEALS